MNLSEIKEIAQTKITLLNEELQQWQAVYDGITNVHGSNLATQHIITPSNLSHVNKSLNQGPPAHTVPEGYDVNWTFEQKIQRFTNIINRAFSSKQFREETLKMEGPERTQITLGENPTSKYKLLLKHGYIAAKFNKANRYTFYMPYEWVNQDRTDILSERYPLNEAFGSLPTTNRNAQFIEWLTK